MKKLRKIIWLSKRLKVMNIQEVVYRAGEALSLILMKICFHSGITPFRKQDYHYSNFSFCVAKDSVLPDMAWDLDRLGSDRESLLSGKCDALGFKWIWEETGDIWKYAPDTGNYWPGGFFSSIDYREGNPYGDIRITWEPSRLQHLVSLALTGRHSDKNTARRAVKILERQLESWIDCNPCLDGIHYISSMECALRILSVCFSLDLARGSLSVSDRLWGKILGMIYEHASLICKRMSLHSSAGNHTIAECTGLIYAAILFPEFDEAGSWREKGVRLLNREIGNQILPDGGGVERTLWYHAFVTDLSGLALSLLEKAGERNVGEVRQSVIRARRFLNAFSHNPEGLPMIGDSDNGYALSKYLRLTWMSVTGMNHLETFSETGISVLRDVEDNIGLFLDHGPIGMAPCYGHGHADGLAVSLRDRSGKLLDNAGTYTYTGDADWRRYFRGTSAHNTVCVDGEDQAVQQSSFMWASPYNARLVSSRVEASETFLLACHDGYLANKGIVHWRGIIHTVGSGFVIWDFLDGDGRHELALNWHTPRLEAQDQEILSISDSIDIGIDGGEVNLVAGSEGSHLGWMSDLYGVKYPCYTINTTYIGNLPHEFITRIISAGRQVDSDTVTRGIARFKEIINEAKTN